MATSFPATNEGQRDKCAESKEQNDDAATPERRLHALQGRGWSNTA